MSPANNHLGLLATLTLLFLDVIGAIEITAYTSAAPTTAAFVPCEGGSNRLLELEELVHISDVVMYGAVLSNTITQDEFGTLRAKVSYYFAFKYDPLLYMRGLASVDVTNFPKRPSDESSYFFLVREPNAELSIYCQATLGNLDGSLEGVSSGLYEIIEKVKEVATADIERNNNFVPPYPDPCDPSHFTANCSSVGSYCTVVNTLSNETARCTCISGFHGDGFTCSPRTDGAAEMECSQCTHGARCMTVPPSGVAAVPADEAQQLGNSVLLPNSQDKEEEDTEPRIDCNCQHYKCTGLASKKFCATNGVTYNNECYMRREACLRQTSIYKLYNGNCNENATEPCGGLGAPLSTSAGLVNCSATNSCPTMHFCHNTNFFGVCCPVTAPTSITTQRLVTVTTPSSAPPSSGSGEWKYGDRDTESSGSGAGEDGGGARDTEGGAGSGDNNVD